MIRPDIAQDRLRTVVTQVRERSFDYRRRPNRPRDWHLYDLAQSHELEEVLRLIRAVVETDSAERPRPGSLLGTPSGRPSTPLADLLKALLWQSYRHSANRPAEGELRVVELGLSRRFSYKTLERAFSHPEVKAALPRLLAITNRPLRGLETVFSIDGSGFPVTVRDHYRSERDRQNGEDREAGYLPRGPRSWVRNVANVGVRFGLVAGWKSWTDDHLAEVHCFGAVLDQTKESHPQMTQQLGDGAYSSRPLVGQARERGVRCRFLPRRTANLKSLGEPWWRPSLWGWW